MITSVLERLNDRRDAAADLGEDAGFTLIELMVVLLILAILLAIAIPTFLGVTGGANDRAAQSNINTSLTTAKAMATQNNQQYIDLAAAPAQTAATQFAVVQSNEPAITWNLDTAVATQGPVSVHFSADGNGVIVASYSKNSKTCWIAVDNLQGVNALAVGETAPYTAGGSATTFPGNAGTYYAKSTAACNANTATAGAVWGNKF